MRRTKRPLPIPQHEFGFTPDAFNLFAEPALDGDHLTREQAETQHRRQLADQAQPRLFVPSSEISNLKSEIA